MTHVRARGWATTLSGLASFGLVMATTLAQASGAAASSTAESPPRNDSSATPQVISAVPTTIEQDTTSATSATSDPGCVGAASVWFSYRPSTTTTLRAVTFGSSYRTRLAVFRGRATTDRLVACNGHRVRGFRGSGVAVRFVAGTRYLIAVSRDTAKKAASGGPMTLTVYRPRRLQVESLAVTRALAGGTSGGLFVTSMITLSQPAITEVVVEANEKVADHVATSEGDSVFPTVRTTTFRDSLLSWSWAFEPGRVRLDYECLLNDGWRFRAFHLVRYSSVLPGPGLRALSAPRR